MNTLSAGVAETAAANLGSIIFGAELVVVWIALDQGHQERQGYCSFVGLDLDEGSK